MPAPPNPVVGQYIRHTVVFFLNDQAGEMTVAHQVRTVVGAGATLPQINGDILTRIQGVLPNWMPLEAYISGVQSELLVTATGKVTQSAVALDNLTVGLDATGALPTQASGIIQKSSGYAGRSMRGRVFWPFHTVGQIDGSGELQGATATGIAASMTNAFGTATAPLTILGAGSLTLVPVILHKVSAAFPLPLSSVDVQSWVGIARFGTQKRRGDYGKHNLPLS